MGGLGELIPVQSANKWLGARSLTPSQFDLKRASLIRYANLLARLSSSARSSPGSLLPNLAR